MMTLAQAVHVARHVPTSELHRALSCLVGCPIGAWGDTMQARGQVVAACPAKSDRDWTVDDLIEATLAVSGGRYAWRAI